MKNGNLITDRRWFIIQYKHNNTHFDNFVIRYGQTLKVEGDQVLMLNEEGEIEYNFHGELIFNDLTYEESCKKRDELRSLVKVMES